MQNSSSIYHSGYINPPAIVNLLNKIENYLSEFNVAPPIKTRITGIAIELLQNIYHHSPALTFDYVQEMPTFLLEKKGSGFMFKATNMINQDNVAFLKNKLMKLNCATPEKLEKLYRDILQNGNLPGEHAGLGWIDIYRKSGKPILFKFTAQSNKYSLFDVTISV